VDAVPRNKVPDRWWFRGYLPPPGSAEASEDAS
jgi:hypothetical protein